jgi:hypothetical protein
MVSCPPQHLNIIENIGIFLMPAKLVNKSVFGPINHVAYLIND